MTGLYRFLRVWARLGLGLFAEKVSISRASDEALRPGVPVILACNHPNSFLDAILMGVLHPRPMHFLARGDAFRKPWAARLLRAMGAIPVHRLSEGREHLHLNEETFEECTTLLKKGGTILIFSEGLSAHGETVRPLRKGTARLAWLAWQEAELKQMLVQPVRLSYQSYTRVPKKAAIHYASPMRLADGWPTDKPAHFYSAFNEVLYERLSEVPEENFRKSGSLFLKIALAPLAAVGFVIHAVYYFPIQNLVQRKTQDTVFYDSVLFGILLLTYPLFVFLLSGIAGWLGGWWLALTLLVLLPASALVLKWFRR